MQARLFALSALVALTACGGGHTDATTQQQTTTRVNGTTGSSAHGRTMQGSGRAGGADSMAGSRSNSAGQPPEFNTEAAAMRHCRSDDVVWLNIKTGVYHAKGTSYYGNTKSGAFACRKEADAAGDRASKAN